MSSNDFKNLALNHKCVIGVARSRLLAVIMSVCDVSIRYFRAIEPIPEGWELLKRDFGRPVVSPTMLAKSLERRETLPALICAAGN